MKQRGILFLIILVGLASIIGGGCSWVSKLTNFPQSSDLALPQAKAAATIDFYAIDLNDFPNEKERLIQEARKYISKLLEQWAGYPIKIEQINILPPFPTRPIATLSPGVADQSLVGYKAVSQEIMAGVRQNKAKYLVASIIAKPLSPREFCAALEKVYQAGKPGPFWVDFRGDETLHEQMYKLFKDCQSKDGEHQ